MGLELFGIAALSTQYNELVLSHGEHPNSLPRTLQLSHLLPLPIYSIPALYMDPTVSLSML